MKNKNSVKQFKKLSNELNKILNEWDFLGVFDKDNQDEYSDIINPILNVLSKEANSITLKKTILDFVTENYGYTPSGTFEVSKKIVEWWNKNNRNYYTVLSKPDKEFIDKFYNPELDRHAMYFPDLLISWNTGEGYLTEGYTFDGVFAGDDWQLSFDDAKRQAKFTYKEYLTGEWHEIPKDIHNNIKDLLSYVLNTLSETEKFSKK